MVTVNSTYCITKHYGQAGASLWRLGRVKVYLIHRDTNLTSL